MNEKAYDQAVDSFSRAENLIPEILGRYLAVRDLLRIHTKKGVALHEQALNLWKEKGISAGTMNLYEKAKINLKKATHIDSMDYITAYWLARTENVLEVLSANFSPETNKNYNAMPLYENAIVLRPNGISVHYAYIRYLNYKGITLKIPGLVRHMAQIYPQAYWHLKNEPFFNDVLMDNLEKGLFSALDNNIFPRNALQALSDIQAEKQEFNKAVTYYQKSLGLQPFYNTSSNYLHMALLYLKTSHHDKSIPWFIKGLKTSDNFDSAINRIFHIHKKEHALEEFIRLSIHVEKNIAPTSNLDINVAKAWMEMERPQLARARLLKLNAKQPNANAYYLLAKIVEKEKNWAQVELLAQKATIFDQENATYYHLFSKALQQQKKYIRAEELSTKAIKYSKKENPWLFSLRAWTRWGQKKYAQAATDWKRALTIKSDHSDFSYWIARAYEQEGLFKEGLIFVQKAIFLDPDNQEYKDLKTKLENRKQ